jgi:thiosulfate dehydrogenase [quinone] large subunit
MSNGINRRGELVQDAPFVQKLLSDPRAGWLFLPLRVWLGW